MPAPLDLQFQQFSHYFVLGKGQHTGHGQFWICQCQCGAQQQIHEDALVEGRARSCGCDYRDTLGKRHIFRDLTGQQHGDYLVLKRSGYTKSKKCAWDCLCVCGTRCLIATGDLLNHSRKQCRTCKYVSVRKIVIGRWYRSRLVQAYMGSPNGHPMYRCQCYLCGRVTQIFGMNLIHGKGCSCAKKGRKDPIIHQLFGRLRVLEYAGMSADGHHACYLCQCSCIQATIKVVPSNHLLAGNIQSCGCLGKEKRFEGLRAYHMARSSDARFDWTLDIMRQHALVASDD